MDEPAFSSIAILGLGQMGASLGLAFQRAGLSAHRSGFDSHSAHANAALACGAIDTICATPQQAVNGADLVILCTPMRSYDALMKQIAGHLKHGAIITDIGSVKLAAIRSLGQDLPAGVSLVPAHPIAGSEKTGPHHARADFFDRRLFLLTPEIADEQNSALRNVSQLWQQIGAQIEVMPPDAHDRIYATMSHVPQLVAYACAPVLNRQAIRRADTDALFSRFIRIGRSDPQMWCDVFLENAVPVVAGTEMVVHLLAHMRDELLIGSGNTKEAPPIPAPETLQRLHKDIWPRMVASTLVVNAGHAEQLLGIRLARYAAGGFIDTTCPATESPEPDFEIVSTHAPTMIVMLSQLIDEMKSINMLISQGNMEPLFKRLSDCQREAFQLIETRH